MQRVWTSIIRALFPSCHRRRRRHRSRRLCSSSPIQQWPDQCFGREDSPSSTLACSPYYEDLVASVLGQGDVREELIRVCGQHESHLRYLRFCANATDYQHCSSGLSYHRHVSLHAHRVRRCLAPYLDCVLHRMRCWRESWLHVGFDARFYSTKL